MTSAIVLAGGLGTRLRSEVPDLPKPMAPIDGRPFLEYQLDFWIAQGVDEFILSVGYRADTIVTHFGERYRGVPVRYAREEQPLGTGGGVILALDMLTGDDPCLVLNGDTLFEIELDRLSHFHRDNASDWTLSLFRTSESGRYMGVEMDQEGRIISLASGIKQGSRLANGGIYLVNPALFKSLGLITGTAISLEDELIPQVMHAGGKLNGIEFGGRFIDIGIPDDYRRAGAFVASMDS